MIEWANLHCHSDYSALDGLSKPIQIFKRCIELDIKAGSLTDHGNCSGSISWLKSKKKYIEQTKNEIEKCTDSFQKDLLTQYLDRAKKFKQILGTELYVKVNDKTNTHLVILAKNKEGWKSLIGLVSEASKKENFYRRPRLSLDQISKYTKDGNLISFSGHPGSQLNSIIWLDEKAAFNAENYEQAKSLVRPDWKEQLIKLAGLYRDIFGKNNWYVEIQKFDEERLPMAAISAKALQWLCKKESYKPLSSGDSHYPVKEQAGDQRVLLCNLLRTTLPKVKKAINDEVEIGMGGFFKSDKYYIPSPEEMSLIHTEEEIYHTIEVADKCEEYSLQNKPTIPKIDCPDNLSSDEYFKQICREGWKEKLDLSLEDRQIYGDRVKKELSVLQGVGLSDYFLLIHDIIKWAKQNDILVGVGRGSAGGCLTAFLSGLIAVNPIEHDLLFERFYNEGRNTKDNVEYPDFDLDVQASARDKVINYIKDKYGHGKVAHISNFNTMKGRLALTEVLRAHEAVSFDEMKRITSLIPDPAAIAGDLQNMEEEEEGSASIIKWSLLNNKKDLSEWCWIEEETGKFDGPLAEFFQQAIRLEGVCRNTSTHAAGIIIFPDEIVDHFPIRYDKNDDIVVALDLKDSEYMGALKADILGVTVLDNIQDCQTSINNEWIYCA